MHLLGILVDRIKELEAEFERWTAAGNPAANWDTSSRGVELARVRNELANVTEDAAQRGLIPRTPPPGPAPAGSRWVRALKAGVWVWTAVRVLTSSDPGREALDVGIGTICAYASAAVGTVCFGPVGGVVGGIAGSVLAPRVDDFAAGSLPQTSGPARLAGAWTGVYQRHDDTGGRGSLVTMFTAHNGQVGGWHYQESWVIKNASVSDNVVTFTHKYDDQCSAHHTFTIINYETRQARSEYEVRCTGGKKGHKGTITYSK